MVTRPTIQRHEFGTDASQRAATAGLREMNGRLMGRATLPTPMNITTISPDFRH